MFDVLTLNLIGWQVPYIFSYFKITRQKISTKIRKEREEEREREEQKERERERVTHNNKNSKNNT